MGPNTLCQGTAEDSRACQPRNKAQGLGQASWPRTLVDLGTDKGREQSEQSRQDSRIWMNVWHGGKC